MVDNKKNLLAEIEQLKRCIADLERKMLEKTAQLEAANKELEKFNYTVSHDLQAPLRRIKSFSEILLEDYSGQLDQLGKDYLQRVRSSAQNMTEMIDALLMLSRSTRGHMIFETLDLAAMAKGIIAGLQRFEPDRKVQIAIADNLHAVGDKRLVKIALTNLLENCWKFTSKMPVGQIEFGSCEIEGQKTFYIRDNGVGFNMAYAATLFQPFQRLHPAEEYEGKGIGLATVQRIFYRHGCEIWAQAAPEKGAIFYFMLPGMED